jgi:DNA-binding MarR family transcriptional regulator
MAEIDDIAAALRSSASRLARRLRAEAGHAEYSTAQVAVIRALLERGSATTSELARIEGVRPQSMSATVASLESMGVVDRRPDPQDARASRVFLTPDGERAILAGRAAKQSWLIETMSERLTVDEQQILGEAAVLIERMLQPHVAERAS